MATQKQLAWRKKFGELYGTKKGTKSKGSTSQSRGVNMTSKKNGNGNGKQGIVSWVTSVIALVIGLSNVFTRINDARTSGSTDKLGLFGRYMVADYAGYDVNAKKWDWHYMIRGYAPIAGGIAFKKGTSILAKTAKIKSLIPRLGL